MANTNHLRILSKGVKAWNEWRKKHPRIKPDFRAADLRNVRLPYANFRHANFDKANLASARLFSAKFEFATLTSANLAAADLSATNLSHANLEGARLPIADLGVSTLTKANLRKSELNFANLAGADIRGADLSKTNLLAANFSGASLDLSNFSGARVHNTVFGDTDLSKVKGLNSMTHTAPSTIGIDTLYASRGKLPDKFLLSAGVPAEVIEKILPLIRKGSAIQWNSCFISYSTKNQKFAERLHSRMRQAGLRVWFDREDMKGGDYLHTQIDRAIQLHDRLLLVLSEESIQSKWVEREVKRTRKIERAEKRRKLFPIRLVDMKTLREWECLDSDTGEDLAEEVRKYHIPDFSNWKNPNGVASPVRLQ